MLGVAKGEIRKEALINNPGASSWVVVLIRKYVVGLIPLKTMF
jgi:hypothetical protein